MQFVLNDLKRLGLSVFEFARVYDDGTAFMLYSNPLVVNM